jgi:hypothetical protein
VRTLRSFQEKRARASRRENMRLKMKWSCYQYVRTNTQKQPCSVVGDEQ